MRKVKLSAHQFDANNFWLSKNPNWWETIP
jgi:hypothetical protein